MKTIMFRLLMFAVLFLLGTGRSSAQHATQGANGASELPDDSLNIFFVYIDHEPTTPVGEVCQRLVKMHNDAVETGDKLIVYLANGNEPFISFTNLKDPVAGMRRDSVSAFYDIIDELQSVVYHEVSITADDDRIKGLLAVDGQFPVFREKKGGKKELCFKSVSFNFYVGSHFWALRGNEEIIAETFVSLDIPAYMDLYNFSRLSFNVLVPEGEKLTHPEGMPFGQHNKGGINQKVRVKEYKP